MLQFEVSFCLICEISVAVWSFSCYLIKMGERGEKENIKWMQQRFDNRLLIFKSTFSVCIGYKMKFTVPQKNDLVGTIPRFQFQKIDKTMKEDCFSMG